MKAICARTFYAMVASVVFAVPCYAQGAAHDPCEIPGYLNITDFSLKRVAEAVKGTKRLNIVVLGTASSALGPDSKTAYPARLQAVLQARFPALAIAVNSQAKPRQTAADMANALDKLLADTRPDLLLWQTGTVDAMRGVDPEDFRSTLDDGVETVQAAGADVVLINMQYSPRIESMIQLNAYLDNMRVVSRDREVPLFDRLGIMRYWNDTGAFDLSAATKDSALATKVHDCLGRALASLVIEAAHLHTKEGKPSQ